MEVDLSVDPFFSLMAVTSPFGFRPKAFLLEGTRSFKFQLDPLPKDLTL
jgi:hypothetical protein